MLEMCKLPSL